MKRFARINLFSMALRMGILVSSLTVAEAGAFADYRVMLIDKEYTYALVGSGSADYLWILSRTPGLPETAKAELLAEARRRGYDTDKLIWVEQK